MANSYYEKVKTFEVKDKIEPLNIIIVRVDGCNFLRFSEVHEFEKPNDKNALDLMNECAKAVLEQFPDVILSYGYNDEYSFIFRKETNFYDRRGSKILSILVSFFTSTYVTKWRAFFPNKEIKYPPSFRARVICCACMEVLQAYLLWRQYECHANNQYDTCFWQLIKSGKTKDEAKEMLKGSLKQHKNELLFQCFNINYKKDIPEIFRQGTCTLKTEVKDIVKYKDNGSPVKRRRRKVITVHSENVASKRFWSDKLFLSKELGQFTEDVIEPRTDCVISFQNESKLVSSNWVVIRIDGCHFHRFSDVHEFEKPNDSRALNLMNSCAGAVLEEFKDIVFAYGVSDEYSFVLTKDSQLYQRCDSGIVSVVVSFFSSMYIMKWNEFFPHKDMKYLPYFDGRAACYALPENIKNYLAWRQVDCHINNQYNTCFWLLVKSGKSKSDAQNYLKGTRTREKNRLLDQLSGIVNYYSTLPPIFRLGSSVYWDKETKILDSEGKSGRIVVVRHCNIIEAGFWKAYPQILNESLDHRFEALVSVLLVASFFGFLWRRWRA